MGPGIGTLFGAIAIVLARLHQESRWSIMLHAAPDDQMAAKASGVYVWLVRTFAFGLSGLIVGVGGALQAGFLGVVTADAFYLEVTFLTLAMLIVGGSGSLSGALVVVPVLTFVTEVLRRFETGVPIGETT